MTRAKQIQQDTEPQDAEAPSGRFDAAGARACDPAQSWRSAFLAGVLSLAGTAQRAGRELLGVARHRNVRLAFDRTLLAVAVVVTVLAGAYLIAVLRLSPQLSSFSQRMSSSPSRAYSASPRLAIGQPLDLERLIEYLETGLGYEHIDAASLDATDEDSNHGATSSPSHGWFSLEPSIHEAESGTLTLSARRYPTPLGTAPGGVTVLHYEDGEITGLLTADSSVQVVELEPVELGAFLGPQRIDRRAIALAHLPPHVVTTMLAAEDSGFWQHGGVSITGIARALWVNLRRGRIVQGGSTITQQLTKNLYLDPSRTWSRKLHEAVLAIELDRRFSKAELLEAWLNEVYWGRRDSVEIVGLGAAARRYFGKNAEDLSLAEAAALAAAIPAPGRLAPTVDLKACRQHRDALLRRLSTLGHIEASAVAEALQAPIEVAPAEAKPLAPHFLDAIALEAAERFGAEDVEAASLQIFTTLDPFDQMAAVRSVEGTLPELEDRWLGSRRGVEAALVSIAPDSGEILAYVGGRDYESSQYDRARQAQRQIGSLFKPFVYATAFDVLSLGPAELVRDEPIEVRYDDEVWRPRNSDGEYRGVVSVRRALELSLNTATVRIGAAAGVTAVATRARDLGVPVDDVEVVPALLLGSSTATPLQMVQAYGVFATGGSKIAAHGIRAIRAPGGQLQGRPVADEKVLDDDVSFLVTSMLEGVVDRGTAAGARRLGYDRPVAGKTGTSNAGRDSWFVGYTQDRATIVWVGFDDSRSSRLNGSRAAVPLWTRFALALPEDSPDPGFEAPTGLVLEWIDPSTGDLAGPYCPTRVRDYRPLGDVGNRCRRHDAPQRRTLVAHASNRATGSLPPRILDADGTDSVVRADARSIASDPTPGQQSVHSGTVLPADFVLAHNDPQPEEPEPWARRLVRADHGGLSATSRELDPESGFDVIQLSGRRGGIVEYRRVRSATPSIGELE